MEFNPIRELLANLGITLPNPERIKPASSKLSPLERKMARLSERKREHDDEDDPRFSFDLMEALEEALLEELLTGEERSLTRPRSPAQAKCWVAAGETATIGGYEIPGMVYVGEGLASVKSYNAIEPSLIIPSLKVNRNNPDYNGQHLDYYPTYGRIPPTSRAAYLEWLSEGRRTRQVHPGYLWLFFYGLERRAFYDLLGAGRKPDMAMQELEVLVEEVRQLRSIYSGSGIYSAFAQKAGLFIDLCTVIDAEDDFYETLDPFNANLILLQIGLGQMIDKRQPIPPEWALAWYVRLSKHRLRTAATRCMEEFKALFALRYAEDYGEGMKLKPGKSLLTVDYYPASQTFNRSVQINIGKLPNVSSFTRKINQLDQMVLNATAELEPLGRLLGRNPNARHTAAAIALLPPELLETHGGDLVQNLRHWLTPKFAQSSEAIAVAGKELFQYWTGANPEKLGKAEAEGLAQMLVILGYGIEPDVRLGGAAPKLNSWVGIFQLDTDVPDLPYLSPEFLTVTLVAHLAIAVASGDELPNAVEQNYLKTRLETMIPLTRSERSRLQAHVQLLLQEKPTLRGLKARVEAVAPETRGAIARFLVGVAVADGQASPKEIDRLTKAYTLLELDPQTLYSDVHDISANPVNFRPASEPITVRSASPTNGHKIPKPHQPLALDMGLIESKITESQEVSSLLADIFVEEAVTTQAALIVGIAGLDAAHSQLLQALGKKMEWQRSELESIAAALSLMLDGALEVINDVAFDRCDEAVIEGDDPFEVNSDVLQELLA
jgi:TerB N-terminal domain/TerB-C domain/Tellurite resistance protein TerB